jgi:ABC-type thiamine transport system ATPase subunit
LCASGHVGLGKILYRDFSGSQRLDKHFFNVGAEAAADQAGSFRDYSGGRQQRLALAREKITHAPVPGVVGVRQCVEGASINQERH